MTTALEAGEVLATGAVQERAVEIDDNKKRARLFAALGKEGGAHQVGICGVGDTA